MPEGSALQLGREPEPDPGFAEDPTVEQADEDGSRPGSAPVRSLLLFALISVVTHHAMLI